MSNCRTPLLTTVLSGLFLSSIVVNAQAKPDGDFSELKARLSGLASDPPGNSVVGIYIADVAAGTEIFSKNGDQLLNPASNAKIVTAACALKTLGPEFRFTTSLHGKKEGSVVRGPLYIKGHADPSLNTSDLFTMVRELSQAGISRVEGDIVVDDTYFDSENLPFAFDQQPDEDNKFRSPVGAVSLNHNALGITVRPSATGMTKSELSFDPPGYAVVINDSITVGQGSNSPKISAVSFEDRTRIRVWGQVVLGSRPVTYYRRIDNPSLFSGYGLKGVLIAAGISVGGSVRVGALPTGVPMLAEHTSEPLSSILWETGKMSNNFVTEMILKTMGAEMTAVPATWDGALKAASEVLEKWGLPKGSYTYRNGSGLFDSNLFSAKQFVTVLRAAYLDSGIRPEFVSQLATGGVDGTIQSRYAGKSEKRRVRAKTGTLADVSTLSGYVLDEAGLRPIAFSILVNKASGYVSAARNYQEKIVGAIAEYLNR